ncbi:MAG: uridine diphosphate-N-acetylglucosamine-binding protein YvcK [Solobacterium sp.]|nr:uridine diphosphate-N-acetylglucosamine-binding protein YvcK [Solobacterium sp.]
MTERNSELRRVVVIGGGHGQSTICRGIKKIPDLDISAIVTVADDGGSTGRLRRQFHIPAMGDIRNVMISLAESETLLGTLMDYRFEDPRGEEKDIAGHNLGNLILTALTQQCGSFFEAVQTAGKILNVKGKIIPATTQVITLFARMEDDVIVKGEANIPDRSNHIREVFYDVPVHATPEAVEAIKAADLIIYGIGSVYTSILPNVIIPEIRNALRETEARKVYFCNAMTQPGETDRYSLEDHVKALTDHGAPVDAVVFANDKIPENILKRYYAEGSTPVTIRQKEHDYRIIETGLLDFHKQLIRHNATKISQTVSELLKQV